MCNAAYQMTKLYPMALIMLLKHQLKSFDKLNVSLPIAYLSNLQNNEMNVFPLCNFLLKSVSNNKNTAPTFSRFWTFVIY